MMNNTFGDELTKLREKKFPGMSLRRVGAILQEKHGFGEYFYTQLNKIERGMIIPSPRLIEDVLDAYGASKQERNELLDHLSAASDLDTLHNIFEHHPGAQKEVSMLYRKVKKRKK